MRRGVLTKVGVSMGIQKRYWQALTLALLGSGASLACAQTYPSKPIRFVVGFDAGGKAFAVIGILNAGRIAHDHA
jgi:hypothetical protein